MAFLTTDELARLRADFAATLPDSCVIEAAAQTDNGDGTWSDGWAMRGTVDCRMVPVTSRDFPQMAAEQLMEGKYYTLTLSGTATIAYGDRVTFDGATYYVRQTHDDVSERLMTRALIERRA